MLVFLFRHRRAIQKSRGSKVRRPEGTMESEPGAPVSIANSTGTTTTTSTTTTSPPSTTTSTSSSSSTSSTTTTTAATTATTSNSSSSSSGGGSSITSNTTSTTTGRQTVPQISVYSGIPDRQTVQVSLVALFTIYIQVNIFFLHCPLLVLVNTASSILMGVLLNFFQMVHFLSKWIIWEGFAFLIHVRVKESQINGLFTGCVPVGGRNAVCALVLLTLWPGDKPLHRLNLTLNKGHATFSADALTAVSLLYPSLFYTEFIRLTF